MTALIHATSHLVALIMSTFFLAVTWTAIRDHWRERSPVAPRGYVALGIFAVCCAWFAYRFGIDVARMFL